MKALKGNIVHAPKLDELELIEHGYMILDEEGTICEIVQSLPESYTGDIVDYGNALIMQSFADMHLHAPQYAYLGLGMDLPLLDWLNTYAFPDESRYADTDFARRVYRKLAKELIARGTTRVVMMASTHTDATLILMEELEKAGVTGYVGKVNLDRNGSEIYQETTEESKSETLRWLEGCNGFRYVKPILCPRFTPACTDELMAWLGETAEKYGLYVESHISENKQEIEWVGQLHPDTERYWESYNKYGLWKDHTVMAHCVYSDEVERKAMRDANVLAVHCADSNVNICSGICPVRTLLEEGNRVALGSDIAGGAQLAMYEVITASIRASKVKCIEEGLAFLTVAEGYYLGTTSGHRYFGAGEGFAVGDKLHAIVVDDSDFPEPAHELTLKERFERSLYLMDKDAIKAVWSEGRQVK